MATLSASLPARLESEGYDGAVTARSYLQEVRDRFLRKKTGLAALGVLSALALASAVGPLLMPYDPNVGLATERLLSIGSPGHLLGTDEQGRDMLTRLLYGGRLSLLTGTAPVFVAVVIGTAIGSTAGFVRGYVGALLMRTMDMFYAFPAILLAIAVAASLGPGSKNSIFAIAIVFIPPISRVAEAATRKVAFLEYI